MNNIIKFAAAATITIFLSSNSGCKKDDNGVDSAGQVTALNQTAQAGSWKITYFFDNTDETNHFTGYTFVFNTNGTVTASNGTTTTNGTWSGGYDDSTVKLYLNFGTATPFLELNDDWHLVSQSATKIILQDVSGGGGGTGYLTFEKI
jgi:hypothetical protein